jgi:hypothetical protein
MHRAGRAWRALRSTLLPLRELRNGMDTRGESSAKRGIRERYHPASSARRPVTLIKKLSIARNPFGGKREPSHALGRSRGGFSTKINARTNRV